MELCALFNLPVHAVYYFAVGQVITALVVAVTWLLHALSLDASEFNGTLLSSRRKHDLLHGLSMI
jgi:hypothetical protein